MNRIFWLHGALWCSILIHANSLLIVDTQGKDSYYYRNLITFAKTAGFQVDYKNIYDLLEDADINHYDALFFMMSPAMISINNSQRIFNTLYSILPINPVLHIPQHCLHVLRSFAHQKNKVIGLILPSTLHYSAILQKSAKQILSTIGQFHHLPQQSQIVINDFLNYLTQSDKQIGSLFGTSLINPAASCSWQPFTSSAQNIATIPLTINQYDPLIQKIMPIGIIIHHQSQNNFYLISKSSAFDFADIQEHFFKNPIDISYRNQLLHAAQATLCALHQASQQLRIPSTIYAPSISKKLTLSHLQHIKKKIAHIQEKSINLKQYGWIFNQSIACGWFDPYDFFGHEDGEHKLDIKVQNIALDRGTKIIHDGGFKLLWFECIPEWYLSSHGLRKDKKEEYIERIQKIASALHSYFAKHHSPIPKIFLGLNLTSNFKSYPVADPVQSLSGTTYTKIPSPFDIKHFWQPEVLDVFDTFVTTFHQQLPIDGVFFDFEMYHAPEQTGSYTDLMDFSDCAWKTYCKWANNKQALHCKNLPSRLCYLQKNKKFRDYFSVLEQASRDIGCVIKQHMRKKIPHLLFAAYAPTLPSSWFYRGIMAGLSSPEEPLLLATFNTDYATHHAWLRNHHIHVLHGTALMLSKLKQSSDFNLIKKQLTHHDFVWYNRPSRMIYEYDENDLNKVWWGIEATPLDCKKLMARIKNEHNP
jgi:hypothetical protein